MGMSHTKQKLYSVTLGKHLLKNMLVAKIRNVEY